MKTVDSKNLKKISIEEFNELIKLGKKYALFDNFVLDLTWFRHEHPGSAFLIDQNIGKDMGKYFVGSYSMENNAKPYTHSFIAGKILKKLICAELEEPYTNVLLGTDDTDLSVISARGVLPTKASSFTKIFNVESKTELIKNVYRFKLTSPNSRVRSFYPGFELEAISFIHCRITYDATTLFAIA